MFYYFYYMNKHILLAFLLIAIQVAGLQSKAHDLFFFSNGRGSAVEAPTAPIAYTLYYQYAGRWGRTLESCMFKVFWNNDLLGWHRPYNYEINIKWYLLKINPNQKNTLKFIADGPEDGYGVSLDNVMITGSDGSVVNVVNYGFEQPKAGALPVNGVVPGWTGEADVGPGSYYSPSWCS